MRDGRTPGTQRIGRHLSKRSAEFQELAHWPSANLRSSPVPLYFSTFFVVGISLNVIGPALSELRDRTGAGIDDIGVLFVGLSAGYLLGSVIGGLAYDKVDGHRMFAAAVVTMGIALFPIAEVTNLIGLFALFTVVGLGAGVADVGANTLLMWRLGANVGRSMNALHLSFAVGALLAPLLVYVGLRTTLRLAPLVGLLLAGWAITLRSPNVGDSEVLEGNEATQQRKADETPNSVAALSVGASFFGLYVGVEVAFSGWIYTYAEEVGFSELAATWVTTTFWIGFTVGRVLAVMSGRRYAPKNLLILGCLGTVGAAVLLVVGGGDAAAVWVGTASMGLASSPQYPVMLTFLERRIAITGRATAWFIGGGGAGALLFPWLAGRWFGASGATALPWTILILGVAMTASLALTARVVGPPKALS